MIEEQKRDERADVQQNDFWTEYQRLDSVNIEILTSFYQCGCIFCWSTSYKLLLVEMVWHLLNISA